MANPIPTEQRFVTSNGTAVKTEEEWFARELFEKISNAKPNLGKENSLVVRQTCDFLGQNVEVIYGLVQQVKATRDAQS